MVGLQGSMALVALWELVSEDEITSGVILRKAYQGTIVDFEIIPKPVNWIAHSENYVRAIVPYKFRSKNAVAR